jgi:outer membrane lipoprotein-sorting protein
MKKLTFSLIFLILTTPLTANAITAEDKGLSIAEEWKKRDINWVDYRANVEMVLKNKHGQKSIRTFLYSSMEVQENNARTDGDKVLVIFDTPKDVKGTTLLTYSHFTKDDDQWLYLPAIKRTKRISSHNKSGSFVGSEFAYEDITFQEVEKYTYKWMYDEMYNDFDCFVVERFPTDKENTGYLRQLVWYDKEHYRIHKIEFFDRKNSLLKTQSFKSYNKYLDNIWRANDELMVNHQTGKSTVLTWSKYTFHIGLTNNKFNKSALERRR